MSLPAGLGSNPIGLDRGQLGAAARRGLSARGPEGADGRSRTTASARSPKRSRAARRRRFVRPLGALGVQGGGRRGRSACWWTPRRSSSATRTASSIGCGRPSRARYRMDESRSAFYLPRTKGFPKNTEVETTHHVHHRRSPAGSCRQVAPTPQAVTVRQHHSFVAAPGRPATCRAGSIRASGVIGMTFYDFATPIAGRSSSVGRASPPAKEGPGAPRVRAGEADRLLRGQRRARTDPSALLEGASLVEPGVRGRRFPQRVPGEGAARRRRPDGRPLQHDQLGAPLDARLVVRRQRRRPAHGGDHQGQRVTSARCGCGRTS